MATKAKILSREEKWDLVIDQRTNFWNINIGQVFKYRDLLLLFVRRDIVTIYKQTILGPLWIFIQPVMTTIIFVIIFGKVAKISTDGLPPVLFYLSGIVAWNFFC